MGTAMITRLRQISKAVHMADIYSPAWATEEGKKLGLNVGEAMDLTTGWDFRKREHRDKAWNYVKEVKPRLAIGSPMRTMFSRLQGLTPRNGNKHEK